nr:ADM_HP1_G0015150.mRNA.1.CDS.1 [Saccharomyces cerevisiae]
MAGTVPLLSGVPRSFRATGNLLRGPYYADLGEVTNNLRHERGPKSQYAESLRKILGTYEGFSRGSYPPKTENDGALVGACVLLHLTPIFWPDSSAVPARPSAQVFMAKPVSNPKNSVTELGELR